MKLGILTLRLTTSYGGILQNYALQTCLKRMGHDAITLETPYKEVTYTPVRFLLSITKRLLIKLFFPGRVHYIHPVREYRLRYRPGVHQQAFIRQNIDKMDVGQFTNDFCEANAFDGFVVGSDQVWRPTFVPDLANYFLHFTNDQPVRRVAYAASFGVDAWEFTPELTLACSADLQQFDAISVREDSGITLCKEYLGVDAEQVIDPTLLLTPADYNALLPGAVASKGDYLLVYVLDWTREKRRIVSFLCRRKGLTPLYIGIVTRQGLEPVENWIDGFNRACYVFTDSFHGTAFALLYNLPFVSICNAARGSTRFTSLLNGLGLSDRLIHGERELVEKWEHLQYAPDFQSVNARLEIQRQRSRQFLAEALDTNLPVTHERK